MQSADAQLPRHETRLSCRRLPTDLFVMSANHGAITTWALLIMIAFAPAADAYQWRAPSLYKPGRKSFAASTRLAPLRMAEKQPDEIDGTMDANEFIDRAERVQLRATRLSPLRMAENQPDETDGIMDASAFIDVPRHVSNKGPSRRRCGCSAVI